MEDYPGNSRASKAAPQQKATPVEGLQEVKLDKVVTGKVIKRKKPLGRRIMDTFFNGDTDSVIGYLGRQVLLPALQDIVTDVVKQGIEKAVYGEVRSASRTSRGASTVGRGTHISYDRPSSIVRSTTVSPSSAPRRAVTQPSAFNIGEIILESHVACETVIEQMNSVVEEYGAATVANLNDLIGQTSAYTDHKWGWTDLSGMTMKRISEGWLLLLPEPEDLR